MAIRKGEIRNVLRKYVEPERLTRLEDLAHDVDIIRDELDAETSKTAAWSLAMEWASEISALASLELALLTELMEQFAVDREPIRVRIAELRQAKDQSWRDFQDVGGAAGLPMGEAKTARIDFIRKEHAAALVRNREFADEIRKEAAKLRNKVNISAMGRDVRSLQGFLRRFRPSDDLSRSPAHVFADEWVAKMDRPVDLAVKAARKRALAAKRRPKNPDWDQVRKDHVEKARRARAKA